VVRKCFTDTRLTPIEPEAYALALAQQSNTVLWCTGLIQSATAATILLLNTVMNKSIILVSFELFLNIRLL
jgi:hypothetical protein